MKLPTLIAAICCLPALALAQDDTAAPPDENKALRFFLKSWRCDDVTRLAPDSPEIKIKTDYRMKEILGGFWFTLSFEQRKQSNFPGFMGEGTFGWDAGRKKYVFVGFDNAGGSLELTATAAGDKVEWTGDIHVPGANALAKYTWTKKGSLEASFSIEVQAGEGKWMKLSDAQCKART